MLHSLVMIWALLPLKYQLRCDNFDEDDPENIVHVKLMAWCNGYKQRKTCKRKINKGLISLVLTYKKSVGLVYNKR